MKNYNLPTYVKQAILRSFAKLLHATMGLVEEVQEKIKVLTAT